MGKGFMLSSVFFGLKNWKSCEGSRVRVKFCCLRLGF